MCTEFRTHGLLKADIVNRAFSWCQICRHRCRTAGCHSDNFRCAYGTLWTAHYGDVIMGTMVSQITSLTIVNPIVYSDADQRKRHSSASLAFVRGIHRGPVNSPHKWPVTRKMFPFDNVIMRQGDCVTVSEGAEGSTAECDVISLQCQYLTGPAGPPGATAQATATEEHACVLGKSAQGLHIYNFLPI